MRDCSGVGLGCEIILLLQGNTVNQLKASI